MTTKYIIVSGGVVSGLGKGITASSIALLLKMHNFSVNVIKIDPYLNVDSGTMSPYEHGECYILEDGSETDLDLGNYERFLETNLSKHNSITSGQIYKSVIDNEREGKYLGKTVQMVPHLTDEIIRRIEEPYMEYSYDFCVIELGGTVGDIESSIYLEAIRQLSNITSVFHVHVSLIPRIGDEDKTKPTQTSIRMLMSKGIFPNMLVIRCKNTVKSNVLDKLSLFSNLCYKRIIQNVDVNSIYEVPELFVNQSVDKEILEYFKINKTNTNNILVDYKLISNNLLNNTKKKIGIIGKYTGSNDTYLSIIRSIEHASYKLNTNIKIVFIDDKNELYNVKSNLDGIIIPGGFGYRGCELKMKAIDLAYMLDIPILGICLGFQLMIIYLFRNVIGLNNVYHGEWDEYNKLNLNLIFPIDKIEYVYKDENDKGMGGTMRLGSHKINIKSGTLAYKLYKSSSIDERHRHRYGLVNKYKKLLENDDIVISGSSKETEIIELKSKKYFIGCQYHPEMKTRLSNPHPLFIGLIERLGKVR